MNLSALISDSLSHDAQVRSNAEQGLRACENTPSFLLELIQIIASHDLRIKLAASVYFKNRIQHAYDLSSGKITEEEKGKIKSIILQVIAQNMDILNVRSQLICALGVMLRCDLNAGLWPSFVNQLESELASEDITRIHTGLLGFLEFVKVYQWTLQKKRGPLNQAIEHLFPGLCVLGTKLLEHLNFKSGEMVKAIAKIFCASIRMELAKFLQDSQNLAGWATFLIQVIQKEIPENADGLPKDLEEREKYPWWKAKKWAYQSLYHLYSRYAWSLKKDKRYSAFSKMFMEFFLPNIVQAYLLQVQSFVSGAWMTDRVKQQIAMFLEECIKPKTAWLLVKPHLEIMIMHFIFPILCFNASDQELWDNDPVEFIHKKIDSPVDDYRSPVTAGEELLTSIVVDRYKQTFMPVMTLINAILTKYQNSPPESRNYLEKEGALRMIALLADHLLDDDSPFKSQMENFIYSHVTPEIASPHPFLRARACDVLLKFGSLKFEDNAKVCAAFQSVIQCLKDPELPVRVSAALSISPFLTHETIHEAMKPHVHTIMHELLTLTNEIDMDTLTNVMEDLVSNFSEQIAPFSVQLATQLSATFMRIMGEYAPDNEEVDADDTENKTFAAMGVLKTITSLIMAVEASPAILAELETVLAPIIFHVLKNTIFGNLYNLMEDLYEEIFEMVEMCMFCSKSVSQTLWHLFDVIYHTFKSDGLEFLEEMEPTLDSYIVYGSEVLKQSPEMQLRYVDIISSIMTSEVEYVTDSDRLRACRLMESMMLNLKPNIDNHLPIFLQLAFKYLSNEEKMKSAPFRVHVLEVIINGIYYNHNLTLSFLENHGATAAFFELWFKHIDDFTRVHDKKLCIVSIITLLQIPQESLPASIRSGWTQFFELLLKTFEKYPEALEERIRQEKLENGEFEEDEEDGIVEEEGVLHHHEDHDEEQEEDPAYLDYLNSREPDGSDRSDDGSDWSLDLMMEEDIYYTTPLDKLNAYVLFGTLMTHLIATPIFTERIQNGLSPEKKSFIEFLMAKSTQEIKS